MNNAEIIKTKGKCDQDIYEHGIEVFETKDYKVGVYFMGKWVNKVAKLSGQRVDFHKSGYSTWVVKALGDITKVNKVIRKIKHEYNRYYKQRWIAQRRTEIGCELKELNKKIGELSKRNDNINTEILEIESKKKKLQKERKGLIVN